MGESKEITTIEDLRRVRLADDGYLVITDSARPAIVHKINEKCISTDSFNMKVTLNRGRQGKWYWADSLSTAMLEFEAKRCKVCKPPYLLVPSKAFDEQ